jgi:hypothetical protein
VTQRPIPELQPVMNHAVVCMSWSKSTARQTVGPEGRPCTVPIFLSSLDRMSPGEVSRITRRSGRVAVGAGIDRLNTPASTQIRAEPPAVLHARLAAGIRVESGELTRPCRPP